MSSDSFCIFLQTPDRKVHAGVIDRSELIHQFRPSWYCYEPEGIRCYLPIPLTPIRYQSCTKFPEDFDAFLIALSLKERFFLLKPNVLYMSMHCNAQIYGQYRSACSSVVTIDLALTYIRLGFHWPGQCSISKIFLNQLTHFLRILKLQP